MSYQRSKLEPEPDSEESDSGNIEHDDPDEAFNLEQISVPPLESEIRKSKPKAKDDDQLSPQECTCCCDTFFSTKFALITILVTLLTIICLVVSLDLTILTYERQSRSHYFRPVYYSESDSNGTTEENLIEMTVKGTKLEYEWVDYIPHRVRPFVKSIECEYVEVPSTKEFLRSLDYTSKLETLILRNIKFKGRLPHDEHNRPTLNTLQNFVLSINEPIGPTHSLSLDYCDNCLKDNSTELFSSLSDPSCLRHLIFFDKRSIDFYETGDILRLKTNISIWIWGFNYFTLNYRKGEITTMLNYTDHLLRNISANPYDFKLETLNIKGASISIDSSTLELFSGTIKNLFLDSVNITMTNSSLSLSKLLTKFTKLEQLTIKMTDYTNYYDSSLWDRLSVSSNIYGYLNQLPRTIIDLADLPTSLMNLTLSNVEIICSNMTNTNSNTSTLLNFNLDQLVLHHVNIMSPEIINHFTRLFRVKRIAYQVWDYRITPQGRQVPSFTWRQVLQKVAGSGATWIYMDNTFAGELGFHQGSEESSGEVPIMLPDTKRFILDKMDHPSFWEEEVVSTPEDGKVLWFSLLRIEIFVDKDLALNSTW